MCRVIGSPSNISVNNKNAQLQNLLIKLSDKFDVVAACEVFNFEGLNMIPEDNKLGPFDLSERELVENLRDYINARAQQRRSCDKNHKEAPEFWRFLVQHKFKTKKGS